MSSTWGKGKHLMDPGCITKVQASLSKAPCGPCDAAYETLRHKSSEALAGGLGGLQPDRWDDLVFAGQCMKAIHMFWLAISLIGTVHARLLAIMWARRPRDPSERFELTSSSYWASGGAAVQQPQWGRPGGWMAKVADSWLAGGVGGRLACPG